jgi:hypothetical protein
MIRARSKTLVACLTAGLLATAAGVSSAKDYPKCNLKHPGRTDRAAKLLTDGDTEVSKAVAKHVVKYAIRKYGLDGVVTEDEIKEARSQMYSFLKWKLGNPSAIAAQWVSAGYKHFDKAYSDEAGAAVLGSNLPGPAAELKLPKAFSSWLKAKVDSLTMANGDEPSLCDQLTGGAEGESNSPATASTASTSSASGEDEGSAGGALLGVGCELTLAAVKEAIKLAIDRIGISLSAGKAWDIPNRDVELMVYARLHPVKISKVAKVNQSMAVPKSNGKGKATTATAGAGR